MVESQEMSELMEHCAACRCSVLNIQIHVACLRRRQSISSEVRPRGPYAMASVDGVK